MKKILFISGMLLSQSIFAAPPETDQNKILLPSPFPVYTDGKVIINHPEQNFSQKLLPTDNRYQDNPGCYIACYSNQSKDAVGAVGANIFLMGQVRVPGTYNNRICIPTNYEGKDISAASEFKKICNTNIATCNGACWAGGDTGGWFGIQ